MIELLIGRIERGLTLPAIAFEPQRTQHYLLYFSVQGFLYQFLIADRALIDQLIIIFLHIGCMANFAKYCLTVSTFDRLVLWQAAALLTFDLVKHVVTLTHIIDRDSFGQLDLFNLLLD